MPSWPQRVRRAPWLTRPASRLAVGLLLAALIVVPFGLDNYYRNLLTNICVYAMLGLGLNIVVGYAVLLDLGYAAFFAIGAYVAAYLMTTYNCSFWLILPIIAAQASF